MQGLIRQGDVLLVPIATAPQGKIVKPGKRGHVLAEGEATGHAHTIREQEGVKLISKGQADELRLWLLVEAPVELEHQEHATLTIPPGSYEVRRQREYSPEAIRRVTD